MHAFQLRRCAYSILEHVFTFIAAAGDHLLHFNEFVDKELRAIAGILPVLTLDLGCDVLPRVYVSDASLLGYPVLYGVFDADVVETAVGCR